MKFSDKMTNAQREIKRAKDRVYLSKKKQKRKL